MILNTLFLENFRNTQNSSFEFQKNQTLILGPNGIGKTSIIEAISALATTKPFRNSKKEIFLQHTASYGRVKGSLSYEEKINELEVYWEIKPRNQQQCFYNYIPLNPSEYLRQTPLKCVLFSPEEMNIPFGSPLKRRQFLSKVLSPLFPDYIEAALKYNSLLKQRNKLLFLISENKASREECIFWDQELEKHYDTIVKYRKKFLSFINKSIQKQYFSLSQKDEAVRIEYISSYPENISFKEALAHHLEKDIRYKCTTIGAHRDDFEFFLRDHPLEEEGSRGEVRSVILALKFLEKQFVESHSLFPPLLLLDDVFSELDPIHRLSLISSIEGHQSIITTTDIDLPKSFSKNIQTLYLS